MKRIATSLAALAMGALFAGSALAQGYQSQLDKRNAAVRSVLLPNVNDPSPQYQPQPARPAPAPNSINCRNNVCYDDQGRVYQTIGRGLIQRPDGGRCQHTGRTWNCN